MLYNPDDFRHVYVYEGDDQPLVMLSHEHLRPETPAWSFKEAKERLKSQRSKSTPAAQAKQFDLDLYAQNVADSRPPKLKRPSKHARNRETAQLEKEAKAIGRAAKQPVPMPPPVKFGMLADIAPAALHQAFVQVMHDNNLAVPLLKEMEGGVL